MIAPLKATPDWGLLSEELRSGRHAFISIDGRGTLVVRRMRGNDQAHIRQLAGLAIPELVELDDDERRELVGSYDKPILATRYAGRWLGYYPFSVGQLIGAWLFVLEQLVAMRRRGLLYTDVKFANVVCEPGVKNLRIIDLEGCVPVAHDDRYSFSRVPYTPRFAAPEHLHLVEHQRTDAYLTEANLVYQIGWLALGAFGAQQRLPIDADMPTRWRIFSEFYMARYPHFYELCRACMHERPELRPRTYEQALTQASSALSAPVYRRAWRVRDRLRMPYSSVLVALGL
jgi:hypothetical protein